MPMSTTEMKDEFGVTHAPGSSRRRPTKPLTGEVMTVFARLIFSSSSRAPACENCALARSSCASGRLIARVGVVEGLPRNQLAFEQVARAIEVGLRQPQVGLALTDRRGRHFIRGLRLLDLLQELVVFDLGELLTARDAIAQPHEDLLEPAGDLGHGFDRRGADQIADDGQLRRRDRRA